jgi:hypothetical protein
VVEESDQVSGAPLPAKGEKVFANPDINAEVRGWVVVVVGKGITEQTLPHLLRNRHVLA